jgi:hypothetical protein
VKPILYISLFGRDISLYPVPQCAITYIVNSFGSKEMLQKISVSNFALEFCDMTVELSSQNDLPI